MTRHDDVVVVGAGLAGLLAAAHVVAAGRRATVVDPHPPGGRARSAEQAGVTLNQGPHAVYDHGALRRELTAVGVRPTGAPPRSDGGVRSGDRVEPFPTSVRRLATTRLLGGRGKLAIARLLGTVQRQDPRSLVGRTVTEWLEPLPDDAAALARVLVRVTSYTNAPDLLDAGAALRQLQLGLRGVTYVDGGWQSIVDALEARVLAGGGSIVRDEVVSVGRDGDDVVVVGADGRYAGPSCVLAAGGPALAGRLAGRTVPGVDRLGPPAEAAALDVVTATAPRRSVLFDVGAPLYWSLHAPVARLAPPGTWLATALEYLPAGEPRPDPDTVLSRLEEHARIAGADLDHATLRRYLRAMTVHHGVPLAAQGGLASRPSVDALDGGDTRGVFLAGDWVGPEGMLADATAASARAAAAAALGVRGALAEASAARR